MANSFITLQNIARQTFLRLHDNLVMPNLCYTNYSNEFKDLGDTIQVPKPVKLQANKFTQGSTDTRQDMKKDSVPVKLDQIATVDVKWGAIEGATNLTEEKLIADFIQPAAAALAEQINTDGLLLYQQVPYPSHSLSRSEITYRVKVAACELNISESTVYKALRRARKLIAIERGLRTEEDSSLLKQYFIRKTR